MIGVITAVMMLAATGPYVITDATAEAKHWAEFSWYSGYTRVAVNERVLIGSLANARADGGGVTWMRRTRVEGGKITVTWADSRTCPAMQGTLEAMHALPMPQFKPPSIGDGVIVGKSFDGRTYSLTGPVGYGAMWNGQQTINSDEDTPLAKWVEDTRAALAPCWSKKVPPPL